MKTLRTSERFRVYRRVHLILSKSHPRLFPTRGERPPLKTGILKDLISVHGKETTATNIRIFMRVWTRSTAYLRSVSKGGGRYGLDMQPDGEVIERHAIEARDKVRIRWKGKTRRNC